MIQRGGTIGILGGGQLGRMLALAAAPLGYRCHVFCPEKNGPASEVCAKHTEAPYTNKEALKEFSSQVDIVTYEFENVPVEATRLIEKNVSVFPSSLSLHICSNRKNEKEFAAKNGIATAPWEYVPDRETLGKAIKKIGCPAILKSEESGYDGKGQALIKSEKNSKLDLAWDSIGRVPAILEKQISFEREISVILARDNNDICTVYPPIQNTHKNGILDYSISPAIMGKLQLQKATDIATSVARGLNHIGVLCVELFVNPDGELLLNEVAPRCAQLWSFDN